MPQASDRAQGGASGSVIGDRLTEEVRLAERARKEGRLEEAEQLLVAALYEAERHGAQESHPDATASAWELLARIRSRAGAPDAAITAYERTISARLRARDGRGAGDALVRLARIARRGGQHERAEKALDDADRTYAESGHPEGAGRVGAERARLAFERGDLDGARACFERVLDLARERGDRLALADAVNDLGNVLAASGQLEPALERYREAETIYEELGQLDGLEDCRRNAARAQSALEAVVSPDDSEPPPGTTWAPTRRKGAGFKVLSGASDDRLASYLTAVGETARLCSRAAEAASLDEALGVVLQTTLELIGADRGAILLREDSGALRFHMGLDSGGQRLSADQLQVSRTITAAVARSGRGLYVTDLRVDPQFKASSSVQEQGLRSAMATPLRLPPEEVELLRAAASISHAEAASSSSTRKRRSVLGVLYIDSTRKKSYTDVDFLLFDAVGTAAAQALRAARLAHALRTEKENVEKLNAALSSTVRSQEQELVVARAERDRVRRELALRHEYSDIVWASAKMRDVLRLLDRVTETNLPVLVNGESGTGKELLARAIHRNGPRSNQPFVSVNCAAISGSLLESELFGHMRGSFTGATEDRPGLFELAHGGTLFLDEVGDMPLDMQSRLLRALQEGEIRRIGGKDIIRVDVRAIAATHRDLRGMAAAGDFREDLYYRLNVITVTVPPLRERREDITPLCYRILEEISRGDSTDDASTAGPVRIERDALGILSRHDWPGNVRELENALRCLATFAPDGVITEDATRRYIEQAQAGDGSDDGARAPSADGSLRDIERLVIDERLRLHGWRQTETARSLGIDRKTLYRKIKEFGLRPDQPTR